ncbi:ribonuclease 3-like protein 2 [Cynara cardunculus var. scolymus]|uniref:Double-stranded RNA-binding n=1 Tax=Cynara cardunculus var. scolymus TaxID=59895 RepID=A0A124SHR8_CYNCS|nr:ribonuclease 3-like protein 2 [Cynara cardunculus var. scolymus]KVI10423.1 Double-stranded RNA-binding [Cynara cardunculus var. scolymus]
MSSIDSGDSRGRLSEKIIYTYGVDIVSGDYVDWETGEGTVKCTINMEESVAAVESILGYTFNNKSLLEEALTHPSYSESPSYQRLEFVGDAVLGLVISNFVFVTYPDLDPGQLSLLRSANISTEKLARVAVNHGLYKYVRHKAAALNDKVREFVMAVQEEDNMVVHGGHMKAPKVLADIVESVAAAVYIDCGSNLQIIWMIMRVLLEPIAMLNDIEKQPQPITLLYEACQKNQKDVIIRHWRKGDRNIASVYVDGRFVASGSSDNKENAKLHAAEAAFSKLTSSKSSDPVSTQMYDDFNKTIEVESAKQRVHELCNKKRWSKPIYRIESQSGPAHERRYISSVTIKVCDVILGVVGDEKSRVKEAESSAAVAMLCALRESGYI